MRHIPWVAAAIALSVIASAPLALAQGKPLIVPKFEGKFVWLKVRSLPARTLQALGSARSIVFDLSFPHDVSLTKDTHGYRWFTFVLADQGRDSKWHQTSHAGIVPASGDGIKAGRYLISVPLDGIPKSVLTDKRQTLSLGPNTSGLAKPVAFSVGGWRAK